MASQEHAKSVVPSMPRETGHVYWSFTNTFQPQEEAHQEPTQHSRMQSRGNSIEMLQNTRPHQEVILIQHQRTVIPQRSTPGLCLLNCFGNLQRQTDMHYNHPELLAPAEVQDATP